MTVDDIDTEAKFRLRALRDDYVHAFVIYFVAEFSACAQKTVISTGKKTKLSDSRAMTLVCRLAPGAGYTHWKQTVFYFPDCATIKQNEILEGTYRCKVNRENPVSSLTTIHAYR